jgi:hypothetical protein
MTSPAPSLTLCLLLFLLRLLSAERGVPVCLGVAPLRSRCGLAFGFLPCRRALHGCSGESFWLERPLTCCAILGRADWTQ